MLEPEQLHEYQKKAIMHQMLNPKSMLWLGMGLGKTAITLSSIAHLIKIGEVKKVLIVAPITVLYSVWDNVESNKWSHTKHLKASIIHGSPSKRLQALVNPDSDIYGINYENLNWLTEQLKRQYLDKGLPVPFEMVVYDEVSKLKNPSTVRIKGCKKELLEERKDDAGYTRLDGDGKPLMFPILDDKNKPMYHITPGWKEISPMFKYRTGLTGTPASNGMIDLFGQYLMLDDGERLGKYITHFRDNFFKQGYNGFGYDITEFGEEMINKKIGDVTLSMQTRDYIDLPDVVYKDIMVDMTPKARKHYDELEKQLFTQLDSGTDIELESAVSVSNKCRQVANGAIYTHDAGEIITWEKIHEEKMKALEGVLEEAGGKPVLCAYAYKTDAELIMKKFKKLKPRNITGSSPQELKKILKEFGEGKIKLLLAHPQSAGHGIDGLQKTCTTIAWYGMPWSLEQYLQLNARIDRQGQKHVVSIVHIMCRDSIDLVVKDAIENKDTSQLALLTAMKKYKSDKT